MCGEAGKLAMLCDTPGSMNRSAHMLVEWVAVMMTKTEGWLYEISYIFIEVIVIVVFCVAIFNFVNELGNLKAASSLSSSWDLFLPLLVHVSSCASCNSFVSNIPANNPKTLDVAGGMLAKMKIWKTLTAVRCRGEIIASGTKNQSGWGGSSSSASQIIQTCWEDRRKLREGMWSDTHQLEMWKSKLSLSTSTTKATRNLQPTMDQSKVYPAQVGIPQFVYYQSKIGHTMLNEAESMKSNGCPVPVSCSTSADFRQVLSLLQIKYRWTWDGTPHSYTCDHQSGSKSNPSFTFDKGLQKKAEEGYTTHQFAAEERKILHQDVSPWNIWVFIRAWSQRNTVPSWDGGPPDLHSGLLGDWSLVIPMEGFEEVVLPSESTILEGDNNISYDAKQAVYDHMKVTHALHHNIKSFFWVIFVVHVQGEFYSMMAPLIHPFWSNIPIRNGMKKLYNMFLPESLATAQSEAVFGGVNINLPHPPLCFYETMISILQYIADNVRNNPVCSKEKVEVARQCFLGSFQTMKFFSSHADGNPLNEPIIMQTNINGMLMDVMSLEKFYQESKQILGPVGKSQNKKTSHIEPKKVHSPSFTSFPQNHLKLLYPDLHPKVSLPPSLKRDLPKVSKPASNVEEQLPSKTAKHKRHTKKPEPSEHKVVADETEGSRGEDGEDELPWEISGHIFLESTSTLLVSTCGHSGKGSVTVVKSVQCLAFLFSTMTSFNNLIQEIAKAAKMKFAQLALTQLHWKHKIPAKGEWKLLANDVDYKIMLKSIKAKKGNPVIFFYLLKAVEIEGPPLLSTVWNHLVMTNYNELPSGENNGIKGQILGIF
ncbi:hypothetical protein PAXRUDRAFT_27581 [Paxillus rubicundulus Ve08.2h10]|uniref:Uncharacterized protein n=1 Tax=Paxillus rubicundulus Ve08.2h10 TaxID=930991 RepID=A0A0D0CIK3_9AGAM|nr:hypothetical protein PAXRUDRAFT_27581 [Paxillus rubicundulus Ve08.2h10]